MSTGREYYYGWFADEGNDACYGVSSALTLDASDSVEKLINTIFGFHNPQFYHENRDADRIGPQIRAHGGGAAVKYGTAPPKDAVILSYYETPELKPKNTVEIRRTAENNDPLTVVETLWPDPAGLLRNGNGQEMFEGQDFEVTNIFKNDIPLFYLHTGRKLLPVPSSPL